MKTISVKSVNISKEKGTVKKPVRIIELTHQGVSGDAHAGPWNRQVSMLASESIEKFEHQAHRKVKPGEFAENITTQGLELWKTHPLDRFTNDEIELEVTQIGKECHGSSCAIFNEVGDCVMPREGIFCRVLSPGILQKGMILHYHPRMFRVMVITLSDRASAGEYEDRSGARVRELLQQWFSENNRQHYVHYFLIPDNPHKLEELMEKAKEELIDIVITTGGTGIGQRDFTPDIVKPLLDKEIPGIMEAIRMKYGQKKPAALCSRSVAGVMGKTLVFTLPGSVRAVNEYLEEIFNSLLHMIYMLHGLDIH
ncbi:MAG: molybdopterin-binding protein [Bacteroidales bacterium]|nr:molybdopterin-binding protein [Bacteroidales bacterium]HNW74976.1 molybdopterin-binding protein [Bacteroidales bacterium]HPS51713.1 molybdopterin-binding protein [Bacteroidales bacterium]